TFTLRPSLLKALADFGVELDVVPCGGASDAIDQQREQWTDGANAFAIAPGLILLYRRNRRTMEELARRGQRIPPAAGGPARPAGRTCSAAGRRWFRWLPTSCREPAAVRAA